MLVAELLSGIIIDKFGEMRSQEERILEDSKKACFICGQTRETLEKSNKTNFKQHTGIEHNIWNYMFFLEYLIRAGRYGSEDLGESEKFILDSMMNKEDQQWYPCYFDYEELEEMEEQEQLQRLVTYTKSKFTNQQRLENKLDELLKVYNKGESDGPEMRRMNMFPGQGESPDGRAPGGFRPPKQ